MNIWESSRHALVQKDQISYDIIEQPGEEPQICLTLRWHSTAYIGKFYGNFQDSTAIINDY